MQQTINAGRAEQASAHELYVFIPHAVFLLLATVIVAAICFFNHGANFYTLDDAYIHLALAQRIGEGTYGINAGEFAAPDSSMIWPFLLSLFSHTSFFALVPGVLNLAAALGTLTIMAGVTRRAVDQGPGRTATIWLAAFITLLIPATNMMALAFTGMEHSAQQLLAVAIVAGLIEESRTTRAPPYLWVAIFLIPLIRFDAMALAVPALVYLGRQKHLRGTLATGLVLFAALATFSWFLESHGLGYLPTSVVAKSEAVRGSGSIRGMVLNVYGNVVLSTQGILLLLGSVVLSATALNDRRPARDRGLAATVAAALLLHIGLGAMGAFFRYEAYLTAAAVLMLIYLHRDSLRTIFATDSSSGARIPVLCTLAVVGMGYTYALLSTPLAANNIYDQQYQLHRFAVDYYKKPIAVNDLGLAAFGNPNYVLDLWGLGSAEAQHYRLSEPNGDWMERLCQKHGVDLIMIYDEWFPNRPANWIPLGSLELLRTKITPFAAKVRFYARDAETAARARSLLSEFARSLPEGAAFALAPTTAP